MTKSVARFHSFVFPAIDLLAFRLWSAPQDHSVQRGDSLLRAQVRQKVSLRSKADSPVRPFDSLAIRLLRGR
jgi:hypothetical protein